MRISSRLKLTSSIVIAILGISILVALWTFQQVKNAYENELLITDIDNTFHEISVLRDEYLLRHEERAKIQWYTKTERVKILLEKAKKRLSDIQMQEILSEISEKFNLSVFLFSSLTDYFNTTKDIEKKFFTLEAERMLSQIIVNGYDLFSANNKLQELSQTELKTTNERTMVIVFVLMVLSVFVTVGNSLSLNKMMGKRIAMLSEGAKIIGNGNLDHRIIVEGDDELSVLAKTNNDMALKLRDSYTSVENLEKEIAERKQAEKALKKSEAKYRSMMESMTDPVYICSPEFTIEYINPRMRERVGRGAMGEKCYSAIHNLNSRCEWCVFHKVAAGEILETTIVSPKDNRNYHVTNMPIKNKDESISKMSIFRDITDYLTAIAENEKARAHLQQVQKMEAIGTLAGGIAHDFNNILFPIVGHTEMMIEDTPEDSPLREGLNEIYHGALRARDLVQQILTFSRQENAELKMMKMQPIIKEVLKLIRSTIPTTISINQNLQPNCGAVKADPTQIHQVVMNLATNAYHAMEENGGELNVTLKEIKSGEDDLITPDLMPGSYACLTIADTGLGMDKKTIDKIFEPFFTTKDKWKGTGMGLSVVHGIVKSMNGAIQVHSEPGKGAEFHIFLPIVKSAYEKQELQVNKPILCGTERVLLVDDEKSIIAMERQVLERLGYYVTSRVSSIEALEAFRANPEKFDIVISDMAMPKLPGDKLAVELIRIRTDIPVLLCTGFSEAMTDEKIKSLGIKGLLMKPVEMKAFARKLREVLDKKNEI